MQITRLHRALRLWSAAIAISILSAAAQAQGTAALRPDIDPEALAKFEAFMKETKSRSALIMHKGEIVAEWYWLGATAEKSMEVWSLSKSMASTAIGFLIDEGKIKSVDDPVYLYIPSWKDGGLKERCTVRNLLIQNSGLQDKALLATPKDLLKQCCDAPILSAPGEVSRYNNGGCNVLSAIISAAAGEDPEKYMGRKMWQPLGMKNTSWRRDDGGNVITYAGVQTTPRDLVKWGQLFLHEGKWDGKQLLSAKWIDEATTKHNELSVPSHKADYGYLWWLNFDDGKAPRNYSALGLWGNNLTVIPELDLIGVRLAGNNADGGSMMNRIPEWVAALAAVVRR